jgi:hypothetical protein
MRLHYRRILLIFVFILLFLGWTGVVVLYNNAGHHPKVIQYLRRELVEQELRV